ncbi:prepilin-type N-terminal cleavage/methylation domain-containing protein [Allofournierella sp.]|uniref:prepilin-type N-terminal cleavage/methylation domain-containing protein n=1 Tax=Allofournierella sp. TaxID=1940256 RepID=UPI003AB30C28
MLKKMLKQRSKKGFTLIELIVVLVILAILAAAAIPTMMGYVNKARKASYLANCRAVYVATKAALTESMAVTQDASVTLATNSLKVLNGDTVLKTVQDMVPEVGAKVDATTGEKYTIALGGTVTAPTVTSVTYTSADGKTTVTLEPGTDVNLGS